jgi:hypothetical protein
MEKANQNNAFKIIDMARLIGIQPSLLNKLIQRKKYGIRPSARPGKGQGKGRLFSDQDLYGIALVYWLFESGLRSDSIQFVLNQICGGRLGSNANDAAAAVLGRRGEVLAISREPRTGFARHPAQTTKLVDAENAAQLARENLTGSLLLIPVGSMFTSLMKKREVADGNL